MIEFKLPDIGEGIAEGEIVKWLVAEGDSVEEHQPVVEVMTDKATVEIPAPAAGKVVKQLVAEGDTVPVGDVIFHLEKGGAGGQASSGGSGQASVGAAAAPARQSGGQAGSSGGSGSTGGSGGGRTIEFKLPDIGEGIAEGEIVSWLVEEGAQVEEHQPVVEVMTDKATVEIPAPAAGTVVKRLASAGDTVPVGTVIFHLQTAGGGASQAAPAPASGGGAPAGGGGTGGPRGGASSNGSHSSSKVLAVPSARRVARELGVDLAAVEGSGRGGVVRRADVEAFARSGAAAAPAPAPAREASKPAAAPAPAFAAQATRGQERRVPFRGVRRKIADAMVRSKQTAPHFTVVEECDVTELVALREKAKAVGAEHGIKVTYMPFIMKAVALGLARYQSLNGRLDEEAQEIVNPAEVHLGIATDTPNGLIVPVVPDVQAKGILQLAAELGELAGRTREGKVKPEELRGSTFTITNAGNIGGTLATPIINFPDIAILGVHRLMKRPGVFEGPEGEEIGIRQYMNLSCSVDHRLADGADAARFLAYMRQLLETPGLLSL